MYSWTKLEMNQFFHWLWAPIKLFNNFYRQNTPFCKRHVSTKTTIGVFFFSVTLIPSLILDILCIVYPLPFFSHCLWFAWYPLLFHMRKKRDITTTYFITIEFRSKQEIETRSLPTFWIWKKGTFSFFFFFFNRDPTHNKKEEGVINSIYWDRSSKRGRGRTFIMFVSRCL